MIDRQIGIPPRVVQEGIANDILTLSGGDVFELIRWGGTTYKGPWGEELLVVTPDGQGIIQTGDNWKDNMNVSRFMVRH